MDALRKDDIDRARNTSPGTKLREALELMELGIALQRRRLQSRDPSATSSEIEVIDLLAAPSGIEAEIVAAATETRELPGVRVALPEHLLAMKILSMRDARLQDRIDARGLLAVGPIDLVEVRRLLELITSRGFARGQDLDAKLAALLVDSSAD